MKTRKNLSAEGKSASQEIVDVIKRQSDWRGKKESRNNYQPVRIDLVKMFLKNKFIWTSTNFIKKLINIFIS